MGLLLVRTRPGAFSENDWDNQQCFFFCPRRDAFQALGGKIGQSFLGDICSYSLMGKSYRKRKFLVRVQKRQQCFSSKWGRYSGKGYRFESCWGLIPNYGRLILQETQRLSFCLISIGRNIFYSSLVSALLSS